MKCNVCYALFSSLIKELFWNYKIHCVLPQRTQFNSLLIFPGILSLVWRGFWAPRPGRREFVYNWFRFCTAEHSPLNQRIVFVIVQPIKCSLPSILSSFPAHPNIFKKMTAIVRSFLSSLDDAVKWTRKNSQELRPSNPEHTPVVKGSVKLSAIRPALPVFITRWVTWAWKSGLFCLFVCLFLLPRKRTSNNWSKCA